MSSEVNMFPVTSHATCLDHAPAITPYRLTYKLRPEYLYVHCQSDAMNYVIARQYWNEIIVMSTRIRCKRLLVDKDTFAESSMVDAFRIASEIAVEFKSVKIAVCDRRTPLESIEFDDLVATNRGLNTRSFRDLATAEAWLLEGV